jgi:hypothetical protein
MNRAQFKSSVQAFCSVHRPISAKTVRELMRRGLLHLNGDRWRLGDNSNPGVTRSLNDLDWKHSHSSGNTWHGLIGLNDMIEHNRQIAWIVIEGTKDALAAAEIAHRNGALAKTAILCALGSGYRPIHSELKMLQGRQVIVIGDNDTAGRETTHLVLQELWAQKIAPLFLDWSLIPFPCKDLYEWFSRGGPGVNGISRVILTFSPPLPPSKGSSVHVFKCSSQETTPEAGTNKDEQLGIVFPFIVIKKGTGNRMAFLLARAIRHRKFTMTEIEQVFHLWFAKSTRFLPSDADEQKALQHFYRQMRRVRFTDEGMKSACERARKAQPPFVPGRDGDETVAALAALCRELQREAGGQPFICPVTLAQQFLGVKGRATAAWFLTVLEDEKVIECVDRGIPNKRGVKGKPTLWRYKLPMED